MVRCSRLLWVLLNLWIAEKEGRRGTECLWVSGVMGCGKGGKIGDGLYGFIGTEDV